MKTTTFKRLDPVVKRGGDYLFCGHVLAPLEKLSGAVRYAVEDPFGRIFIMHGGQLVLADDRERERAVEGMLGRLVDWPEFAQGRLEEWPPAVDPTPVDDRLGKLRREIGRMRQAAASMALDHGVDPDSFTHVRSLNQILKMIDEMSDPERTDAPAASLQRAQAREPEVPPAGGPANSTGGQQQR